MSTLGNENSTSATVHNVFKIVTNNISQFENTEKGSLNFGNLKF